MEEAARISQIVERPIRDLFRQNHRAGNSPAQLYQRDNRGSRRVRIGGIKTIGIVLGPTVVQEEPFLPKLVTTPQGVIQLIDQPGRYRSRF